MICGYLRASALQAATRDAADADSKTGHAADHPPGAPLDPIEFDTAFLAWLTDGDDPAAATFRELLELLKTSRSSMSSASASDRPNPMQGGA